jgi:hypothetical protein
MFKFIGKNFSQITSIGSISGLDPYIKTSLDKLKILNLSNIQRDIYTSIQDNRPTMLLCDDHCGRKYGTMLGLMNRVLSNSCNYTPSDEFYRVPRDIYELNLKNSEFNSYKKSIKPHGVIVLCHKFDFLTHYYKILRKLDYMNRLRVVRLGNSLQSVTPSVENDNSESEEKDEMMDTIKLNLINSTEWKKIDFLFTSPNMMELAMSNKDNYDYFDINPEIIVIDDYDYILK